MGLGFARGGGGWRARGAGRTRGGQVSALCGKASRPAAILPAHDLLARHTSQVNLPLRPPSGARPLTPAHLPCCACHAVPQAGPSRWLAPRPTKPARSRCGCARPPTAGLPSVGWAHTWQGSWPVAKQQSSTYLLKCT